MEFSYHWSVSAGYGHSRFDTEGVSHPGEHLFSSRSLHSSSGFDQFFLTQHRSAIKVTRSEILDSPFSKPTLKPEVRRRLDDIASQTLAHIAVVNSPLALSNRTPPDGISSNAGWSGLETERVCELVVTGTEDAVDLARVRLLVMLDELVRYDFWQNFSASDSISEWFAFRSL